MNILGSYKSILSDLEIMDKSIQKKNHRSQKRKLSSNHSRALILTVNSRVNTEIINDDRNLQSKYPEILKQYVKENVALKELEKIRDAIKQIQHDKGSRIALETFNNYEAWAKENNLH